MADWLDDLSPEERKRARQESFPDWLDAMKATLTDNRFSSPDWIYEPKLDGERLLAFVHNGKPVLYSRTRKRVLKGALEFRDPLRYTTHRNEDGESYYRQACQKGWEGVIAKRADSAYRQSRSRDWLKFKCVNQQELVIGGYTDPKGERTGFGALLLGYYNENELHYAGRVGTGFDEAMLKKLHQHLVSLDRKTSPFDGGAPEDAPDVHWVTPKLVCEVGFTEWTRAGRLRHPRFLGMRDDKPASEVRRERPE